YMFALAELMVLDASGKNLARGATVTALDSIEVPPRWRKANLVDGIVPPAVARARTDAAALEARRRALAERLLDASGRQERESLARETAAVRRELATLPPQRLVYAGTVFSGGGAFAGTGARGGKPRPIHVLARGDVRKPGKLAVPGALSAIKELPSR